MLRKGKSCLAIGRECAERQKAKHTIKHLSIIYTYICIDRYIYEYAVGSRTEVLGLPVPSDAKWAGCYAPL